LPLKLASDDATSARSRLTNLRFALIAAFLDYAMAVQQTDGFSTAYMPSNDMAVQPDTARHCDANDARHFEASASTARNRIGCLLWLRQLSAATPLFCAMYVSVR
jgi:hypothetical protein